ncbi:MAG TPA: transglycosylase domain-containing protein [Propionicimonas sp.]|nr:transglycosylase domain-containing protein [Propionicimonas sp.]
MRIGKRLYSLMMFIVVAFLGGLLAAGLIVPVAGMATATGTGMVESLDNLPTELETPPQPERSRLLNADNSVLAYFYDENRIYETLDKIAPIMQQAQVAIEDHRFYEHGALDLTGTLRALVRSSQGNTQGGSSLTQQYVRLVLVEIADENNDATAKAAATENTIARKIRELRYAIALEKKVSKDKILEGYLNIAYYGDGAYGVEAAAKHYFNTSAAKLTLAQAAMLAGLVRNPVATNPVDHTPQAIERRNTVLDRMAELTDASGAPLITAQQLAEAKAEPFDKKKVTESRLGCANSKFPFICDYALDVLKQQATSLGTTPKERLNAVYRGGLTITTQIDPKAQRQAQRVLSKRVSPRDPAIGVIVMMEPDTGLIRAMAQSRPVMGLNWRQGQTFYNYAVGRSMHGGDGFQGGSTFKAFVAAAALQNGYGTSTTYRVGRSRNYKGEIFSSCAGSFKVQSKWVVDGPEVGNYNMWNGTSQSVNNYFVPLEQAVGLCPVTKMAKAVGLQLASGKDVVKEFNNIASFTLGSAEVTPLSMVTAYGTFANRGVRCNPSIIKSIKNKKGDELDKPEAGCKKVMDQGVADAVNKIFQGPFTSGTLTRSRIYGTTLAGKTGTVPSNKAAWTVGYTPDLVTAAVISYDNGPRFKKYWKNHRGYLHGIVLPKSKTYLSGFGSDAGWMLFKPAMTYALKDINKNTPFNNPPQSVLNGDTVDVPSCSGRGPSSCAALLHAAGFSTYYSKQYHPTIPSGGLIGTSGGGSAGKGSQIAIYVSKGPEPAPPVEPTPTPTPTKPRRGPR